MEQTQKPLSVSDAVLFTGYSKYYIYKLISQKKIPCFKPMGGRVFFKKEDLEKFIFRNRQEAVSRA